MYTRDDVAKLLEELGKREFDPPIEVSDAYRFGLAVDVYDPLSGIVISVCRPHRSDIGQPEILRTPEEVATMVAQARAQRAEYNRLHGVLTDEQVKANEKAQKAALAAKEERLEKQAAADPNAPRPLTAAEIEANRLRHAPHAPKHRDHRAGKDAR